MPHHHHHDNDNDNWLIGAVALLVFITSDVLQMLALYVFVAFVLFATDNRAAAGGWLLFWPSIGFALFLLKAIVEAPAYRRAKAAERRRAGPPRPLTPRERATRAVSALRGRGNTTR